MTQRSSAFPRTAASEPKVADSLSHFHLIQVSIMRIISKLFLAGLALAAAPAKACDSTLDIVLDTSGASGFDNNGDDFDILRELVLLTGECR